MNCDKSDYDESLYKFRYFSRMEKVILPVFVQIADL